jgi:hypothetical protein
MKKSQVIFGAISLLTLSAANANTLVLDSYNYSPALELEVNAVTTSASGTVTSIESGAQADYTLTYTITADGDASTDANKAGVSAGILSYEESASGDASLDIKYSFAGGATLDVSGYSAFYFDVKTLDAVGGFQVLLTLTDNDGTTIFGSYDISTTGVYFANIGGMSAGAAGTTAGFDLSQVAVADTFISSALGIGNDFQLDEVGLVPEPSALAVLGLGLIGLGLRRRKLA